MGYYRLRPIYFFFFQAEDGIRDLTVTGVQTCALPILRSRRRRRAVPDERPVEGAGRGPGPPPGPLHRDRRYPLLRSQGSEGRSRLPEIGRASCRERV